MKPYIEIDCRTCYNCNGEECIKYGADTDVATQQCAEEAFRNYVQKQNQEAYDSLEKAHTSNKRTGKRLF